MERHRSTLLVGFVLLVTIFALNIKELNSYFLADEFDIIESVYDKKPVDFLKLFYSDYTSPRRAREIVELMGLTKPVGMIRPFVNISHKWELFVYGTRPFGYHLTQALLHFTSSLLVFLIIHFFTSSRIMGLIGGLLFAVNPALFQVVGWIATRGEVLALPFYLASFYFFIRYRSDKLRRYYLLSFLTFFIGLFTKENLVVLPILLICYDLLQDFRLEVIRLQIKSNFLETIRKHRLAWVPYLIVLVVYFSIRKVSLGSLFAGYGESNMAYDITQKLKALVFYVNYLFFAHPFNLYSPYNQLTSRQLGQAVVLFLVILPLMLVLGYRRVNRRLVVFSLLWLVISYAPIFVYPSTAAPIILYPVAPGVAALMVALIFSLPWRQLGLALSAFLIAFYGFYQFTYNARIGAAGRITQQVREQVEASTKRYHDKDTVILVDIPQIHQVVYLFAVDSFLQAALEKPFSSTDLTNRFNLIRATYSSFGLFKQYPSISDVIKGNPKKARGVLSPKNNLDVSLNHHDVHLLKWDDKVGALKEYDVPVFIKHLSGAYVQPPGPYKVGVEIFDIHGDSRLTLLELPSSNLSYQLTIPHHSFLSFGIALSPIIWDRANGVTFEIRVRDDQREDKIFSKYIDPKNNPSDRRWHDATIDLRRYEGKNVKLSLVTSQPVDEAYSWAGWGNLRLVIK